MAQDILIVDDEADIRNLVSVILEDEGYHPREAANSTDALASIKERRPSLVLLDIWLQGSEMDGIGILRAIKRDHEDLPVVMMSGHGTVETATKALKLGAYDFIEKPFKTDHLLSVIERAVEAAALKRENEELKLRAGDVTELIGKSPAMNHLRQTVLKVAPTNSRVLITGPAGSGKEVVARMLHKNSARSNGPFVIMNCATMRPDRVEIELFGTENSTGGSEKVGLFERAHNGTLFLDEVSDMPLETQGKIVRALQEQIFERIGGKTRVKVDVRVIAATTKDLQQEMADGRFREDLYFRLNVVPVEVPSLTPDCRDDIPLLARHFMERAAETSGQPKRQLGDDAVADLQAYNWPGNIRELRNVIERLLIMAPGGEKDRIGADMLPADLTDKKEACVDETSGAGDYLGLPLREARERFEKVYLEAQVQRFNGNVSRTASFIGMERSALHRKLKSLGIQTK